MARGSSVLQAASRLLRHLGLLSGLWLAVLGLGCDTCHTGHYQVRFEPQHSSYEYDFLWEEWRWVHHPDDCSAQWICDVTCKALDTGRLEAHPEHKTLRQAEDVVDPRCTWDGHTARVR